VSAQLWALVGVVVGALLAGGASLLLAWRAETVQAIAGVAVVCDVLRRAEAVIRKRLPDPPGPSAKAVWWRPDEAASADSWRGYQGALVSRLPREQVAAIEAAMARLAELNSLAALKHARHEEQRAAVQEAELQLAIADQGAPASGHRWPDRGRRGGGRRPGEG
jgi:hypothetical protein